jgi:hypothetical protein
VIAIRNPQIRFDVPGAEVWELRNAEFGEPLREEIRARAEALVASLNERSE